LDEKKYLSTTQIITPIKIKRKSREKRRSLVSTREEGRTSKKRRNLALKPLPKNNKKGNRQKTEKVCRPGKGGPLCDSPKKKSCLNPKKKDIELAREKGPSKECLYLVAKGKPEP